MDFFQFLYSHYRILGVVGFPTDISAFRIASDTLDEGSDRRDEPAQAFADQVWIQVLLSETVSDNFDYFWELW